MPAEVKVLYIAGAHRSGTTLLSDVLGSYDSVTGAGELHELFASLVSGRPCGCGKPLEDCDIWKEVLAHQRVHGEIPRWTPSEAVGWRNHTGRVWHTPELVARSHLHRGTTPGKDRYVRLMSDIYLSIAATQGSRVVVDSTKVPAGAAMLTLMPRVRSYVLHVVRDPRATCHSWARVKVAKTSSKTDDLTPVGTTSASLRWLGYNSLSELLRGDSRSSFCQIRYEDFMSEPEASIDRLSAWMDEPLRPNPFRGDGTVELGVGHSVAGNPSRFTSGATRLELDDRWRSTMSGPKQAYVSALTSPLAWWYGYIGHHPAGGRSGPGSGLSAPGPPGGLARGPLGETGIRSDPETGTGAGFWPQSLPRTGTGAGLRTRPDPDLDDHST